MTTPLEKALTNAMRFGISLATSVAICDLIVRGEEARACVEDRSQPLELRTQALKEARQINSMLVMLAQNGQARFMPPVEGKDEKDDLDVSSNHSN